MLLLANNHSAVPYILVSSFAGYHVVLPLYLALYILLSHRRAFYYPSPRAIALPAAKALPISLVLVYPIAIYFTFVEVPMNYTKISSGGFPFQPLLVAHASLPFTVTLVKEILKRSTEAPKRLNAIWGDADIPHVSRYQDLIFFTVNAAHLLFMANFVLHSSLQIPSYKSATDEAVIQFISFGLSITLWLLFTVWDLRRVRATTVSWKKAVLYITLGTLMIGPAGCLAVAWKWRERTLERLRTRKDEIKTTLGLRPYNTAG